MRMETVSPTLIWNNDTHPPSPSPPPRPPDTLLSPCAEWAESQDVLYQISSLLFAVAFLVPDDFRCHVTLMRATLCLGCACAVSWGAVVLCQADVVAWYGVFLGINAFHLVYAVRAAWPVSVPLELREVYARLFRPLRVTRRQFGELARCGRVMDLPRGADYASEGLTPAGQRLSILLTGRLKATKSDVFLHSITANQFIDSPEYESCLRSTAASGETFQVTLTATEPCRLLSWYLHDLLGHLGPRPDAQAAFSGLVGCDVALKLNQVQQMYHQHPQHWLLLSGGGVAAEETGLGGVSGTTGRTGVMGSEGAGGGEYTRGLGNEGTGVGGMGSLGMGNLGMGNSGMGSVGTGGLEGGVYATGGLGVGGWGVGGAEVPRGGGSDCSPRDSWVGISPREATDATATLTEHSTLLERSVLEGARWEQIRGGGTWNADSRRGEFDRGNMNFNYGGNDGDFDRERDGRDFDRGFSGRDFDHGRDFEVRGGGMNFIRRGSVSDGSFGIDWVVRERPRRGGMNRSGSGVYERESDERRGIELQSILGRSSSVVYIPPCYTLPTRVGLQQGFGNYGRTRVMTVNAAATEGGGGGTLNVNAHGGLNAAAAATAAAAAAASRPRNIFFRANRAGSLESTASSRGVTPTTHVGTTPIGPYSPSQLSFETFV